MTLVRHGESDWNERNLVQGQDNTARLSPMGAAQARGSHRPCSVTALTASSRATSPGPKRPRSSLEQSSASLPRATPCYESAASVSSKAARWKR